MARPMLARDGERLRVNGLEVTYSLWPARRTTRWKLQRRLYVKDPWAILFEAVYRSKLPKRKIREALSYLDVNEHEVIPPWEPTHGWLSVEARLWPGALILHHPPPA